MNWYEDMKCDEIVKRLNQRADELYRSDLPGDGPWTRALKEVLRDIGQERGYQVWASESSEGGFEFHEWLFDVCWAKSDDDWETFKGLAMACEIEWARNSKEKILEDFMKLTVCDVPLRLFISACKRIPSAEGRAELVKERFILLKKTSAWSPGKSYLAMVLPDGGPFDEGVLPYCAHWTS